VIVDVHTHVVLTGLPPVDDPYWPVLREDGGGPYLALSTGRRRAVPAGAVDMRHRLAEMDTLGVGRHLLSPIPAQLADVVGEPAVALRAARAVNDALAGYVAVDPARLTGLGTLPVADPDVVARELARCVGELGLLGVELSSEGFFRLVERDGWSRLAAALRECGAWLLLHPQDDALERRRAVRGRLAIAGVAMTTETALVAVELLRTGSVGAGGPNVILAHGGGTLPFVLGRLDRLWETTDARRDLARRPSELFREAFYVDSCVHDPAALARVAAQAGPGRLLFGSDYPFVVRVGPEVVRQAGLTPPEDVWWGNAAAAGLGARPVPARTGAVDG
jgi:aminocarboxymuconate-semialdehyde decarboxylase